jgi:hypothetical protein
MIKSTIAAAAVLAFSAPAFAGPYVNVESNSGFAGSDYTGGLVESHVGYEGGGEGTSWYVQSGPALVLTDGADSEVELSGKVGGSVEVADNTELYGEASYITGATNGYGLKTGVKYTF